MAAVPKAKGCGEYCLQLGYEDVQHSISIPPYMEILVWGVCCPCGSLAVVGFCMLVASAIR